MSKTQFSTPGNYRIEVEGVLPVVWLDRLGAMCVSTPSLKRNNVVVTTMQGRVADQAELSGILNSLYELHLPLLSVQLLGNEMPPIDDTVN